MCNIFPARIPMLPSTPIYPVLRYIGPSRPWLKPWMCRFLFFYDLYVREPRQNIRSFIPLTNNEQTMRVVRNVVMGRESRIMTDRLGSVSVSSSESILETPSGETTKLRQPNSKLSVANFRSRNTVGIPRAL